MIQTKNDEDFF